MHGIDGCWWDGSMLSTRFPPLHHRWTLFNSIILTDGYFMFFAFAIAGDLNGDDQKIENLRASSFGYPQWKRTPITLSSITEHYKNVFPAQFHKPPASTCLSTSHIDSFLVMATNRLNINKIDSSRKRLSIFLGSRRASTNQMDDTTDKYCNYKTTDCTVTSTKDLYKALNFPKRFECPCKSFSP